MDYKSLKFTIRGVAPLVMHNGQLADPLNEHTKALAKITGKRSKTEADHEQAAKLEWRGSLYLHDGKPCIPGEMIEAAFIEAARKSRRGRQAKAGVLSDGFWLLDYEGPKTADELWKDPQFRLRAGVRVKQSRVMRTRPIFSVWAVTVQLDYLPDQMNHDEVVDIMKTAGSVIGIGDWRPRFGRFELLD